MLSRSKTVLRLIEIRKILHKKENNMGQPPDNFHVEMKEKLDNLLTDIIGVPDEGQYKINEILNKAIREEIKPRTAVVAIHEIYNDYQSQQYQQEAKIDERELNRELTPGPALQELYKNGYR